MPTLYAISLRWTRNYLNWICINSDTSSRELAERNFTRGSRSPNDCFENYETAALKARAKSFSPNQLQFVTPLRRNSLCTFILKFSAAFGEIKMEFFNFNSVVGNVHEIRKFSQLNFPSKNFLFSLFMFLRKVFNILLEKFLLTLVCRSHRHLRHITTSKCVVREEKNLIWFNMLTFWLSFLLEIPSFCYDSLRSFLSLSVFCRSWESTENNKCRISRWLQQSVIGGYWRVGCSGQARAH